VEKVRVIGRTLMEKVLLCVTLVNRRHN
jgi:hypothetical protein